MDIYLDNAATTKIHPKAIAIMNKAMKHSWANPSSIHKKGKEAKTLLDQAKKIIAETIHALPEEIIFCSSATEANNLTIYGILQASKKKEIIISAIEHASVRNLCEEMQKEGYTIHTIAVDKQGFLQLDDLKKKLTKKIAVVSIIYANNEIGSIQNIQKVAEMCKQKNIPFHTDAVQAYKRIPMDVNKTPLTALSFSAHKIHGPKGVAALYLRKGTKLKTIMYGGEQEQGLHPGTENLPAILGFATAAQIFHSHKKMEQKKQYLIKRLEEIPNININTPQKSVSHIINVSITSVDGETLVKHLSRKGIYISTGSACSINKIEPSHVLKALGLSEKQAHSSIRISLSKDTTKREIDQTIKHLKSIVSVLRKL